MRKSIPILFCILCYSAVAISQEQQTQTKSWQEEAEDKPTKQIARQHFKLIGQVNTDYFKGENKVSCWTCHRGEPKAPLLPPSQ